MVSNIFPAGLNLTTWWPLPFLPSASATQTLPSLSIVMPCGKTNIPAPKLASSLPAGSKCRIGASFESAQLDEPQRSKTQTLLPSRSTATAVVPPHARPGGSWPNEAPGPNGLGRSVLGGVPPCAHARPGIVPANVKAAVKNSPDSPVRRIDFFLPFDPIGCVAIACDRYCAATAGFGATTPARPANRRPFTPAGRSAVRYWHRGQVA